MKRLLLILTLMLYPTTAQAELSTRVFYHVKRAATDLADAMATTYVTARSNADEEHEIHATGVILHRTMQQLGASKAQFDEVQRILDNHKSRLAYIPEERTSIEGPLSSVIYWIDEATKIAAGE